MIWRGYTCIMDGLLDLEILGIKGGGCVDIWRGSLMICKKLRRGRDFDAFVLSTSFFCAS
jgi:hypothetical protein